MRKPRDYDAELKALQDKAAALKQRKVLQLGELVIATGSDALDPETLAGALLKMMEANDAPRREAWRKKGVEFFQSRSRQTRNRSQGNPENDPAHAGADAPT